MTREILQAVHCYNGVYVPLTGCVNCENHKGIVCGAVDCGIADKESRDKKYKKMYEDFYKSNVVEFGSKE